MSDTQNKDPIEQEEPLEQEETTEQEDVAEQEETAEQTEATDQKKAKDPKKKKEEPKKSALSKKSKIIITCVIVVLLIVIGILLYLLLCRDEGMDLDDGMIPRGNMVATADNIEDLQQELADRIARGMFETYMTTTWTFADGNAVSEDAVMGNSASNNFPFWFTLTLQGTDQVILTSGLIPLGKQLSEIKLDTPLPKGEYNAVISINMIDEEGEEVDNNVGFGIKIIVLN